MSVWAAVGHAGRHRACRQGWVFQVEAGGAGERKRAWGMQTGIGYAGGYGPCRPGWLKQEQDILARVGRCGKHKAGRHSQSCRRRVCRSRDGPPPAVVYWYAFFDVLTYKA